MTDTRPEPGGWSSPEDRREHILTLLNQRDRATVGELRSLLGVSEVTVRKDLDALEGQGLVTRVHGGAVSSGRARLELSFAAREQIRLEEKRRIAQAAAELIHPGQSIFLDASSTAFQIARLIKDKADITVVTNSLYTALELSFCDSITVVVVGGTVRRRSSSLVGALSHDLLQRIRVDIGFFGARGMTVQDGLTESDIEEALLKQRMVRASACVVGVVDSSKVGLVHLSVFALPAELDCLITDADAPADLVEALRAQQVDVRVV